MTDSFWKGKRVLVTGCTGLLGSALSAELISQNAITTGLIRDQVSHSDLIRSGNIHHLDVVYGDICDLPLLERTLNDYDIDTICHLAAQTLVGPANRQPLETFESNVRGTWNVLEAARRNGRVARIMVASSDKAYGAQPVLPYTEDAPLQGRHPYDVSKSCADLIAQSYGYTYQMPVVVTRCANLYGGGDLNWSRIVPGTIRSLLRGEQPIIRSNGLFQRDYMYVGDAVRAYMTAAEQAERLDIRGQAFNFGMDAPLTALAMVNKISEILGRDDLQPIILDQAKHEIPNQYLASDKAGDRLGWEPAWSLEAGLRKTVAWYRDFLSA